MGKVLQFEPREYDIYGLFSNMTDTQNDLNEKTKLRILWLRKRYEWLQASVIALALCLVVSVGACFWAIHDFKKQPVTVLLENQVQELDKLPLPPLEELKEF